MTTNLAIHTVGAAAPQRPPGLDSDRKGLLIRRIRLLVAFTIAYKVIEERCALMKGILAHLRNSTARRPSRSTGVAQEAPHRALASRASPPPPAQRAVQRLT